MRDAVIVDAVRAPIGRRNGTLKGVHPVDLSASVLAALAGRNQLEPELIEDVVWGCVTQIADQSTNVGRLAVLAAGWPEAIPGVTLDRACGSSQQAVHFAAASVIAGQLVPVSGPDGELTADEGIRRDTSLEKLASLKPAFLDDGVIHAGNSSQISDGCAALLITTSERAAELGLRPLARFHSGAVTGDDPVTMLTAPIPATAKVLKRAGLTIDDIGVFEVNEAFASVPLAWAAETGADHARLNPLGGAIAVGHPLGASGAILMTRMVHHMRANGIRYGLQTMCEAGGMANATVIELLTD